MVALCNEAALAAMRNDISCAIVDGKYFKSALDFLKPRTDAKLLKVYEDFVKSCGGSFPRSSDTFMEQ